MFFVSLSQDLSRAYAEMDAVVGRIQNYLPGFLSTPILAEIDAAATYCPLVYVLSAGPSGHRAWLFGAEPVEGFPLFGYLG